MSDLVFQLINGAPWAITPEMLSEIHRIYEDHRAGRTPDIAAIEAQLGQVSQVMNRKNMRSSMALPSSPSPALSPNG